MFHLAAYTLATGGAVVDADAAAATDLEFSQRNSHLVFSEPYNLLAASAHGATLTRANLQSSTLNAVTRHNIWPVNRAVTVASPAQIDNWTFAPVPLPQNEEISVKLTDTAAEQATAFLWFGSTDWNRNIPAGLPPVPIFEARCTVAITSVANTWVQGGAITLEQNLRGGTYAVVGAAAQRANGMAFRIVFPRNKMYMGRRLRPGTLFNNALGDLLIPQTAYGQMFWGEWGRFSTFELPTVDVFANDSAATAIEMRLWLVRVSDNANVVY